jgi:hypothetical protein
MKLSTLISTASIVACFAFTVPAHATSVVYTERALWEAQVPSPTNINFTGMTAVYTTTGLHVSGVDFFGISDGFLQVADRGFNSGEVLEGAGNPWGIRANLPANTYSVGTDAMNGGTPTTNDFRVVVYSGSDVLNDIHITTYAVPTRSFVGFVSDVPITRVEFTTYWAYTPQLDNFAFAGQGGPETDLIEPNTMVLLGGGLIGMVAVLRRKRLAHS